MRKIAARVWKFIKRLGLRVVGIHEIDIELPPYIHAQLAKEAEEKGISVDKLINKILREGFNELHAEIQEGRLDSKSSARGPKETTISKKGDNNRGSS